MDKDLEKLSALYDGELSPKEIQESLTKMNADDGMKNTFQNFGLISDIVQRHSEQKTPNVSFLKDYFSKINPLMSNLVTAAATVLITLIILYQFDEDRFQVDRDSSLQLSSALSSDQAKNQLLNADQNIMEHMIHIMQSNKSHNSQQVSKNWIPVGFSVNPNDKDSFTTLYTSGAFSRDGEVVAPSGLNQAELMFSKELRAIDTFDQSPYLTNSSKLFDGGSGLVSNIDDYSKFAEMLLNGGTLNGVRILSKASVELMAKNHLSDAILSDGAAFGLKGVGMGLTVGTIMDPGLAGTYSAKGEFFWGGAASTIFWVDRKNNVTATMMTQYMPSDKYPLREELKTLLYSSLSN